MTAGHYSHLPVTGGAGLLGVVDITDVCRALTGAGQDDRNPVTGPGKAARPAFCAHHRSLASAVGQPFRTRRPGTTRSRFPGMLGKTPAPNSRLTLNCCTLQ